MPARKVNNNHSSDSYIHIYNYSIEGKNLFDDNNDYQTFLNFLKDYLCKADSNNNKKTFSIRGKTFQGIPHQPKNYYKKVELIAYSLRADHFHIVVKEVAKGSLEKLVRSLSTRYVIYYNKKYQRRGSLFAGPYRSVHIKSNKELLLLTLFLHRKSLKNKNGDFSSYKYYLGQKSSQFIKQDVVLSYYKSPNNIYEKASIDYKSFIEHFKLEQDDLEILERIVIENISKPSQKQATNPSHTKDSSVSQVQTQKSFRPVINSSKTKPAAFFATSVAVFFILLGLGIKNIESTKANFQNLANQPPPPSPAVSGLQTTGSEITEKTSENPENNNEKINKIIVRSPDTSAGINIREKPSTGSQITGTAKDGDTFELISSDTDWFEISYKGTSAFISKMFAEVLEEE